MYRRALAKPAEWGLLRRVIGVALMAFLLTGALTLPEVWAATYYVNATTGNDANTAAQAQSSATPWKTLTEAIKNHTPSPGDVVVVAPGTYDSALGEQYPLALQDGVKIEGQNKTTTILAAPSKTRVFENINTALTSGTTLTGFTLQDESSPNTTLVYLQPDTVAMSPVIDGNDFESRCGSPHCGVGIYVHNEPKTAGTRSFSGTISNNRFNGFVEGIYLGADLESLTSNDQAMSLAATVSNNTLTNNSFSIDITLDDNAAASLEDSSKVVGNTVTGSAFNDIYYYADIESGNSKAQPMISGNSFTGAGAASISMSFETLENSKDNPTSQAITASPTITNNTINTTNGGEPGIYLRYGSAGTSYSGSVIAHPNINGNKISQASADGIQVQISKGFHPVGSQTSVQLTVANNTVTNAGSKGIDVSASDLTLTGGSLEINNSTVTIAGNTVDWTGASISKGATGIYDHWLFDAEAAGSLNQVISGNKVTNGSSDSGVYVDDEKLWSLDSVADLDLHDNFVTGRTGAGIEVTHGLWRPGSRVLASCNTVTSNDVGFLVDASVTSSSASKNTPDLGGGYVTSLPNPGLNSFYNNSEDNLYDNSAKGGVAAEHNWWGAAPPDSNLIYGANGTPIYSHYLSSAPSVSAVNNLTAAVSSGLITYTATVQMTGDCGCAATTFTAPTPANTTVVPGSAVVTGGTNPVVQKEDPLTVAVGAMAAGDTITVSWQAQANSGYNGPVSEQASLGCSQLPSNVSSNRTVANVGQSVTAIPTLNSAGLALLFGLLFLAGLLLVRKRKSGVV